MSKVDISVSVEKGPYDLMVHLAKLVGAVKAAGGFKASAIPAEIAALVEELPGIISDCAEMVSDVAEDKVAFAKGAVLGADLVVEAVLAPSPAPAV